MMESKLLNVMIGNRKVGTLAEAPNHLVAFEYDDYWIRNGFSISPFYLPLRKEVFIPKGYEPFQGLFGVFSDSLPDGWGRLLVDRLLIKNKINPEQVSQLERLAIVGSSGMGAITYEPERNLETVQSKLSLDEIAEECERIFETNTSNDLDEIFKLGGSSGGARPKVFYELDGEPWIVKFPSSIDRVDIGEQEYAYSICARKCGIQMSETRLLTSKRCSGFFATKRFDRRDSARIHMITASGMLEVTHRMPTLDYNSIMQLTLQLTGDYNAVEQQFRRMCFNIFAHNRDDHSKNFSFLYNEERASWELSPAYDLTYSNSIGGEHATTVDGEGMNPGMKEILSVARTIKIDVAKAENIAEEIEEIVSSELSNYLKV